MLFTNHFKDTIRGAFYTYTAEPCEVSLASPFFSNESILNEIIQQKCMPRLIVRLCRATNAEALKMAMESGVKVRFFTSPLFHSKLYIFGDTAALVGSANLTGSGLQSNQEIAVAILPDDARFVALVRLFQSYWNEAEPLDALKLKLYAELNQQTKVEADPLDAKIKGAFGDIAPSGVHVGGPKRTAEAIYLDGYRRTYQDFLYAYHIVERLYVGEGRRKQPESVLPIRIEIDQFFNYIRQKFATGDSYLESDKLVGAALENNVRKKIQDWHAAQWKYLDETIVANYAHIINAFSSQEHFRSLNFPEIVDALEVCHAFHELLRFYKGGMTSVRQAFMTDNAETRVKNTLCHLVFGPGDFVARMGQCIFDPNYSLHHFGRSCVQELYGWVNDEAPICNGRTVKSLRYLGFDVAVF